VIIFLGLIDHPWRPTVCTESEARSIVGPEGAKVLLGVVEGAWRDYLDEGKARHRSTRAAIVWDYMTNRADVALGEMEGVRRILRYERPLYVMRDFMVMRFKKLDEELATQNYNTAAQRSLDHQGAFPELHWPHVTCGYVLDAAEAAVERAVIVRRVAGVVEWSIPLDELAAGVLAPISPVFDFPGEVRPSLPGIAKRRLDSSEDSQ
jgi:hypothetical protein